MTYNRYFSHPRRRSYKFWFILSIIVITAISCSEHAEKPGQTSSGNKPGKPSSTLTIFAAASLTDSFLEIANRFEAENSGVRLDFNFAGSQQLTQQLIQGAAADLFASADEEYVNSLVETGILKGGSEHLFATNRLVVVYRKDSPIPVQKLEDLASPGLHLVIGAESVPVGKYSLEFLGRASLDEDYGSSFKDNVLRNVMSYEENVKAVLSKVSLGEADAGIVYTSDAINLDPDKIGVLEIPQAYNPTARYYLVVLPATANPDVSSRFIEFVLSSAGQEILKNNGLIPVQ